MTAAHTLRRPIAASDPDLVAGVTDLFARNPFSAPLGIAVVEIAAGSALLSMPIRHEHLNAHGTGHGGALWTLADLAFGAAAWHRGYIMTTGSDLSFFRPTRSGSVVYAQAREVTHKGATGIVAGNLATIAASSGGARVLGSGLTAVAAGSPLVLADPPEIGLFVYGYDAPQRDEIWKELEVDLKSRLGPTCRVVGRGDAKNIRL